jgi:hypothetical protein
MKDMFKTVKSSICFHPVLLSSVMNKTSRLMNGNVFQIYSLIFCPIICCCQTVNLDINNVMYIT